ncbi:uncharacterized protein STEHIDRAFT_154767 [Stereum hirsutum FP-91666 SS1]|uniref:uncharacterized protein n=1 Tax=Stereum hirsutum (strain FP-91666) TaxID=721885 RepID=UPI000440A6F7|nr:uncharacterized protein STEHIDRAFT_154767 [Stereum hirsutum FP-91666 SS1]EIM89080.1 hypothetical protein STEHIDRAFT_154767 [Stereum hirsutum FP-91666 SS1]
MYTPTAAELHEAIAAAHAMTLLGKAGGLRENVKNAHPDWLVSSKRIHQVCQRSDSSTPHAKDDDDGTAWNGLIIHPDIHAHDALSSVQSLLYHIDPCHVDFTTDGAIDKACLRDLLDSEGGQPLLNFYDRDEQEYRWYYSAYAAPSASTKLHNSVMSSIAEDAVTGRVLVVLDGPKGGAWMDSAAISSERLARTIWWYKQSGSNVVEIFGERELRRFVLSLYA